MAWLKTEEGKRAGAPIINDSHKEILFNNWDAQIKNTKQAAEEAATAASNIIDFINKNLHKENLISETTPGYLPQTQKLRQNGNKKLKKR